MRIASHFRVRSWATIAVVALAACGGNDSTQPSAVAGTYTATQMVVTPSGGQSSDLLASGATMNVTLTPQGSVSGHLHVPATAATGNQAIDEDMAGSWKLSGNTVTFTQSADTFVRDVPFTVQGNTLVGDQTFVGTRVQVTLTRQ